MTTKIGINGFGRIGRLSLRRIYDIKDNSLEIVAINDLTSPAMLAHLLKYDTAHGQFNHEVTATENAIVIDGQKIPVYAEKSANDIPWVKNNGVELVLECTGFYTSKEKASSHLKAGVKKVLISAPAGDIKTIVYNVNDDTLNADDQIISAGSCTTNCLAPLAKAINDEFQIKAGTMTTLHAYTSSQMLQDSPDRHGDVRNARAASANIIPHSTGASKAIGLVIPELQGKLTGIALRVPVLTGSITELAVTLAKNVTVNEFNAAVKKHTIENASFGCNEDKVVSSDIIGTEFGSVFDPTITQIATGTDYSQVIKAYAWYDNESGFVAQMIRTLQKIAKLG